MQTFRKEKRITKKPKRALCTKKAEKREKALSKTLVPGKLDLIFAQILFGETQEHELCEPSCKRAKSDADALLSSTPLKPNDASTAVTAAAMASVLPQNEGDVRPSQPIHRVTSFPDIELATPAVASSPPPAFLEEEPGPKLGQITRAVDAPNDIPLLPQSKDLFYVYPEANPEDEYRDKVDYRNLVMLRSPSATSTLPPFSSLLRSLSAQPAWPVPSPTFPTSELISIDLSCYKDRIARAAFCPYVRARRE